MESLIPKLALHGSKNECDKATQKNRGGVGIWESF